MFSCQHIYAIPIQSSELQWSFLTDCVKRQEQPQWPMTCSLFNCTISTRQIIAEMNIAYIWVIIWKYYTNISWE